MNNSLFQYTHITRKILLEKEKFQLTIPSGKASATPPTGPALGQRGINIIEFCKQFNNLTNFFPHNIPITVHVTVYTNKTYKINKLTIQKSFWIKELFKKNETKKSIQKVLTHINKLSIDEKKNPIQNGTTLSSINTFKN